MTVQQFSKIYEDYETPMGDVCDECGKTGERLTRCGECEMRYCDECMTNYVTDAGCPACIEIPQVLVRRLEEMVAEMKGAA